MSCTASTVQVVNLLICVVKNNNHVFAVHTVWAGPVYTCEMLKAAGGNTLQSDIGHMLVSIEFTEYSSTAVYTLLYLINAWGLVCTHSSSSHDTETVSSVMQLMYVNITSL